MIIDKIEFENLGRYDNPYLGVIITFRDEDDNYKEKKIEAIGITAEDFRDQLVELIKKYGEHFYKSPPSEETDFPIFNEKEG